MVPSLAVALAALLSLGASASAATFDAVDRGWWSEGHTSNNRPPGPDHTLAGFSGMGYCSYFVFDLGALTEPVHSGVLELEIFNYTSSDRSETLEAYDYLGSIANLRYSDFDGSIYPDLKTGTVYGSVAVGSEDEGAVVRLKLLPAAILDINRAAGGLFAVGVGVSSLNGGREWLRFSDGDEPRMHRLVLDRPVPAGPKGRFSWLPIALGAVVAGAASAWILS